MEDYLTTGEVAKILGCSKQWVSSLAREGKIESYRIQGSGWHRIKKSTLKQYVQDNNIPVEVPEE